MKLLLDIPFSRSTRDRLAELGHDVISVMDRAPANASDAEIVRIAVAEKRVVLCFDLDFAAIVATSGDVRPSVVTLRTTRRGPGFVTPVLERLLPAIEHELRAGCLVSVEDDRVRVRSLPIARENE